ncbi:MAG: lytic murein transglycosylase [Desulfobacteraceae bacterium]|jgi:membrane-bound lytic murein transglycosylase B|nr:lytic murein transglycosylase [Desulfobacteraceae bacterium]
MPRFDRITIRIFCWATCFAVLWIGLPLQAGATAKNNSDHFQALQQKLITDGFNADKIKGLYSRPQVFFETDGVTILFTYSEAKVDYDQFANKWSIDKAKKYMQQHREELNRVEKAYGVDSRVITAILLVETGLGKNVGKRSALNSLSSLASLMYPDVRRTVYKQIPEDKRPAQKKFEESAKRRSKWAYAELKAFLKYAYQEGFDPAQIPGSFAGAMGYAQFMPSNILAYGKDGNDDGTIDLLTHSDSMASIANFLKRHGWKPGISRKKQEKVIYHYNHSDYYVKTILKIAERLKS